MFIWLMMALSRPFKEDCLALPLSTIPMRRQQMYYIYINLFPIQKSMWYGEESTHDFSLTNLMIITGGSCHKYHFCHDKSFITTNACLSQQNIFVATNKHTFVATKDVLSRQNWYLWQLLPMIHDCHLYHYHKRNHLHPACYDCQSSFQWWGRAPATGRQGSLSFRSPAGMETPLVFPSQHDPASQMEKQVPEWVLCGFFTLYFCNFVLSHSTDGRPFL